MAGPGLIKRCIPHCPLYLKINPFLLLRRRRRTAAEELFRVCHVLEMFITSVCGSDKRPAHLTRQESGDTIYIYISRYRDNILRYIEILKALLYIEFFCQHKYCYILTAFLKSPRIILILLTSNYSHNYFKCIYGSTSFHVVVAVNNSVSLFSL